MPGQQFLDAVDRVLIDALQHMAQVGVRIDPVELRGLCRRPNYAEGKQISEHLP